MNWMQLLSETYDLCREEIGRRRPGSPAILLPICHTTRQTQIEIELDQDGRFLLALVVPEEDSHTIIPCRENSSIRTSAIEPHPLSDKLQYLAAGFEKSFDPEKMRGKAADKFIDKIVYGHQVYLNILSGWCDSAWSHPKARVILKYIQDGTLLTDLVEAGILHFGSNGKLLENWESESGEPPPIFAYRVVRNSNYTVRWRVRNSGGNESAAWKDRSLWDNWIDYYLSSDEQKEGFCFISGERVKLARKHLSKIRAAGDKARLISSRDEKNFTYLGRFTLDSDGEAKNLPHQAAAIGFELSQKAHLALRWLIRKQGFQKHGLVMLAWSPENKAIPSPMLDTLSLVSRIESQARIQFPINGFESPDLIQKRIEAYADNFHPEDRVAVIALDASSKGRLAVNYFRLMKAKDYLQRIQEWHQCCSWTHRYRKFGQIEDGSGILQYQTVPFYGAPSIYAIATAAYGKQARKESIKRSMLRLLPCIIQGADFPEDVLRSVKRRISKPGLLENWEWELGLTVCCALYRYNHPERNYPTSLDPDRDSRDYLFGRLAAILENIERWMLRISRSRQPNTTLRLMPDLIRRPDRAWPRLEQVLHSAQLFLGNRIQSRLTLLEEVKSAFYAEDFYSHRPLNEEFFLGYYSQREALYKKQKSPDLKEHRS